jgi:DNA-binding NtrC family response regulator
MELSSTSLFPSRNPPCSAIGVLLVDADQCFRSGLAENLRDDGHEVRDYAGPEEVPSLAALANIAVAILDYFPPCPNRLALADALHLAMPETAVIMVTAYYSDPNEVEVAARPFVHVQSRPLEYEVLHGLIHRLCIQPPA